MAKAAQSVLSEFEDQGNQHDEEIEVDISYRIINQVSSQLYTNPRRAIEELACNSYDADAEVCYVETPDSPEESLFVLDDGRSMDFDGLDWLWTVAESPKVQNGDEREESNRKQIGKFGVGKLAAYALGKKLTHIAHKNGTTRVVSVDEATLSDTSENQDTPPSFPVNYMSEKEASDVLEPYFEDLPNPYEEGWDDWTLAIVGDLHEDSSGQALKPEYLDQMIRTSLPISSGFIVYRDGKKIEPREPSKDVRYKTSVTSGEFSNWLEGDLKSFWADRLDIEPEEVAPSKYECSTSEIEHYSDTSKTIEALEVPGLGPVTGEATIFDGTLTTGKREERGFQDHGFKITVRGKHLNRHDPLFGVSQRSHKYWSRFFADVEIPGLDDAILVQRNDVNENRIETLLTRRLLKTLFNYCRSKTESKETSESYQPKGFGERLNLYSPFEAAEAVEGLTGEYPGDDIDEIEIKSTSRNEDDRAVLYEDGTVYINEEHPYFKALSEERGYSNFKEGIAEGIAGHLLVKGYLDKHGIEHPLLEASDEIYDDVLRSAASYFRDETAYLQRRLEETSYEGDDPFERAIVTTFRTMKLASRHYGESGNPDGVLRFPMGDEEARVSIEAKGKKEGKKVNHRVANISSITRHRDDNDCDHAVLIAREFTLDGQGGSGDSSLLQEVEREDNLTLLRLDAIKKMLELNKERRMGYSMVYEIITSGKHPEEMIPFITEKWEKQPEPDLMRKILDEGWQLQNESSMRPNAGMLVQNKRIQRIDGIQQRDDIAEIIRVIGHLTGGKVKVYDDGYEFKLDVPPEVILDEMAEQEGEDSFDSEITDYN